MNGDAQGTNVITGGGADLFVFAPGSGVDTIQDFQSGKDKMDVSAYGYTSLAGLHISLSDTGFDTIIDLDGTPAHVAEITLQNRNGVPLSAGDFIFA